MKFSLVIPVFNEAQGLSEFHQELSEALKEIRQEHEIIYIDDGSRDGSLEVLKKIADKFERIRIISFVANCGQSAALSEGFRVARGEWIITLDADGQNPPSEINKLLVFQEGFDFITGVRKDRKDSFLKKLSSNIARFFRQIVIGDCTSDSGCSLRMFKKNIVGSIRLFNNFHRFFPWLVKLYGFSVKEVPVGHRSRKFGKSKYGTFKRLGQGVFDLCGVVWLKKRMINYEVKYRR